MRRFAEAISFGFGKRGVVVIGNKDVTKFRYYRPRPHRAFLKVLSMITNVVVIGEYYTSKKCSFCASRKGDNGGDAWLESGPRGEVRFLVTTHECILCPWHCRSPRLIIIGCRLVGALHYIM